MKAIIVVGCGVVPKKRRLRKKNGLCFHLVFGTTQKRSCETSKKVVIWRRLIEFVIFRWLIEFVTFEVSQTEICQISLKKPVKETLIQGAYKQTSNLIGEIYKKRHQTSFKRPIKETSLQKTYTQTWTLIEEIYDKRPQSSFERRMKVTPNLTHEAYKRDTNARDVQTDLESYTRDL